MTPDDPLLERYREANALDPARPADSVRDTVLARARATATSSPGEARPPVANDAFWRWRAVGGLAVLGLATLVVLQFDRGTPEEREAVLAPAAPAATAPAASAPPRAAPPVVAKPAAPPAPLPAPRTRAAEPDMPTSIPAPAPPLAPAPPPAQSTPATPQAQDRSADAMSESAPAARAQARSESRAALAREIDVNSADPQGRTALMRAALQGDAAQVRRLLDAGADPLRRDLEGRSAADLAREAGHVALLPLLEAATTPPR